MAKRRKTTKKTAAKKAAARKRTDRVTAPIDKIRTNRVKALI